MGRFTRWRRRHFHSQWEESVSDVLGGVKTNIELILKADITQEDKVKLLMRYAVSPREVFYPNVKVIHPKGSSKEPSVEYGTQLVITKEEDGTKTYSMKDGTIWGRGLLFSELDEL